MKIGIQGIVGSFHDLAATNYFENEELDLVTFANFRSLAKCIKAKKLDYGVMAIENTIAGSLLPNYALINEYDLTISGEIYTRIVLNLIGHRGAEVKDLEQVFSHPMALLQSAEYFEKYPGIKLAEYDDTADSVRLIKEKKLSNAGAVASTKAAEIFEMEVLVSGIETNKKNYTRFLILSSRQNGQEKTPGKASMRIITKHHPGSLADVLSIFKAHEINLTKIQSMPLVGQPYQYAFNIDVVWNLYDAYQMALGEIQAITEEIKIHGEYEKGKIPKL